MNTQPVTGGMDRIDIKAALERKGWSLSRLSIANGYCREAAKAALDRRWLRMEFIIAGAIDMNPWEIWPKRYPNGPVPCPEKRPQACSRKSRVNINTGDKK